jgi:hypothetical protein
LSQIDLNNIVEFIDTQDLQKVFEDSFLKPFDASSDLPLWRIIVLGNKTVVFVWSHSFGDGRSGLAFHRAFSAALNKPSDSPDTSIVIPSSASLIEPVENLVDLSPPLGKVLGAILDSIIPARFKQDTSAWTGAYVSKEITLKTHVRIINIEAAEMAKVMTACRANKATVTSVLQILSISILSKLIKEHEPKDYKTIFSYIPLSLRPLSGISDDAFCDHVSAYSTYAKIPSQFSWTKAAELSNTLRAYVKTSPQEIGMFKFVNNKLDNFLLGKLGKKRKAGTEISNLGLFKYPSSIAHEGRQWSIGAMLFAQCDPVLGAALKINVIGDPRGGLSITLTWGENILETSFVESFALQLKEQLLLLESI